MTDFGYFPSKDDRPSLQDLGEAAKDDIKYSSESLYFRRKSIAYGAGALAAFAVFTGHSAGETNAGVSAAVFSTIALGVLSAADTRQTRNRQDGIMIRFKTSAKGTGYHFEQSEYQVNPLQDDALHKQPESTSGDEVSVGSVVSTSLVGMGGWVSTLILLGQSRPNPFMVLGSASFACLGLVLANGQNKFDRLNHDAYCFTEIDDIVNTAEK